MTHKTLYQSIHGAPSKEGRSFIARAADKEGRSFIAHSAEAANGMRDALIHSPIILIGGEGPPLLD